MNALYVSGDTNAMKELVMDFGNEYNMMRSYEHHVAISHQSASDLKEVMHLEDKRVHMILNGIDVSAYEQNLSVKREFRLKRRVHENGLVLGIGGKLTTMKGSQLLREIVPLLVGFKDFPIYFLVAGFGNNSKTGSETQWNIPTVCLFWGHSNPLT